MWDDIITGVVSLVIALIITISGTVFAYYSFSKVQKAFETGWQRMGDDEEAANTAL